MITYIYLKINTNYRLILIIQYFIRTYFIINFTLDRITNYFLSYNIWLYAVFNDDYELHYFEYSLYIFYMTQFGAIGIFHY